jgi:hypothetical protein
MFDELDNLQVAAKQQAPNGWRPAIEFDALKGEGVATTSGLISEPNYDEFLRGAGYDPEIYEVVGNTVRTSKWQQREGGDWLTSFRFTFRLKTATVDLPLLYAQAKKTKPATPPLTASEKVLVVCWADSQTGKVDSRGGTSELIERIIAKQQKLEAHLKKNRYQKILFFNVGDSIEGFDSGGNPLRTNDLSLMQQVDLEATFEWETLKLLAKHAPVEAASVGSNHCAWRQSKTRLGTPQDDWGIHIQRTLARLSFEVGLSIKFYEPELQDESLALDPFGDQSFIVGLVHGHQASKPESMAHWWRGQSHGDQPVAHADLLIHGHWHHLRVQETGRKNNRSRWIVACPTLDNGSSWYRNTMGGDDSDPGLLIIPLTHGEGFTGTVIKL